MAAITGNLLLDALPSAVRQECVARSERVQVRLGEPVLRQGTPSARTFFPTSAVCSLTVGLSSGDKVEAGTVGREGLVGLAFLDARGLCPFSAMVLMPGEGLMVGQDILSGLLDRLPDLRREILVYAGFTMSAVGRAAACNAYHSISQRLARWLLMMHDRSGSERLALTHELLSQMLAATRPRVSLAAGRLRKDGIIAYHRGQVQLLDRKRLEALACECYESNRNDQQTLPWVSFSRAPVVAIASAARA